MSKNYGFTGDLHLRELGNGDLQIVLPENTRQMYAAYLDADEYTLTEVSEMIEESFYAGDFLYYEESPIGLTSAELIVLPVYTNDEAYGILDGDVDWDKTCVWWHPNYMIEDWREILINRGEFIFTKGD